MQEQQRLFGRHFDATNPLVSRISRESIDALKTHFKEEMGKEDWRLVIRLKKTFDIP
jgi:translation initiation factor 5B